MKRKLLWLFIAGIAVGIVGIVLLICLIPSWTAAIWKTRTTSCISTTAKTPTDRAFPEN